MTETIKIELDSEDKKKFEAETGMTVGECMKLLLDNVKYGGRVGLDPFWSEENQKLLSEIAEDVKHGRNMNIHDLIEVE